MQKLRTLLAHLRCELSPRHDWIVLEERRLEDGRTLLVQVCCRCQKRVERGL